MDSPLVKITDLPPPDVLDLEPAYAVELEASVIVDLDPLLEEVESEMKCNNIIIDQHELLAVVITATTKRIMAGNDSDLDNYITEWVTDLIKYKNHWEAESVYTINRYKRLIYILMSKVEEYLLVVLEQRNIVMTTFFAYPIRLGLFLLIPESSHDETVKNILNTVFKPN